MLYLNKEPCTMDESIKTVNDDDDDDDNNNSKNNNNDNNSNNNNLCSAFLSESLRNNCERAPFC